MTSPHQIHSFLYRASHVLTDPGDAGTIRPNKDLQICEMVSTGVETRTVAAPTKSGIRFVLRLLTDGGTVTVTVTGGMNVALNTVATFDTESDILSLVSVQLSAGPPKTYRWEIAEGNTGVSLS